MRYLLDTNVISELAKDNPDSAVVEWCSAHNHDELCMCAITVGEIAYGIEKKDEGKGKDQLQEWFRKELLTWFEGSIIALDTETMLTWGKVKAASRTLPILDSQIAAAALTHDATLVTRNTKDFEDIEKLRVVNPFLSI